VIGSKLTAKSTGVAVSTDEWKQWINKPNDDMAEEYGVTITQSGGKAACWKFFYIIDDHTELAKVKPSLNLVTGSSSKYAMCNKCGDLVLCSNPKNGHTSTTLLVRHCSKHGFPVHNDEISRANPRTPSATASAKKLKQQSIVKSASPLKFQKPTGPEVKAAHQWKVVEYIISASLPFNTVEDPLFKSLPWQSDYCSQMDNVTVKNIIRSKYKELLSHMQQQMKDQVVSVTLDHWTSKAKHNYSGITSHYSDDDWVLKRSDRGCFLHEGGTSSQAIKDDYLSKLFTELGLEQLCLAAMTTDIESKMNSFGIKLGRDLGIWHVYCSCHLLQLTAKLACDDSNYGLYEDGSVCQVISKCRAIVHHFRSSTQAAAKLASKLSLDGRTFKVLTQDVQTRWWSTYDMLYRINESKTSIQLLHQGKEISLIEDSVLTDYEWKLLPQLLELLLPLKQEQKVLEGDKYVTISRVPFSVKHLMKHLDTFANERQDLMGPVKALSKAMYLDFDKRWQCSGGLKYHTLAQRGAGNRMVGVNPIAFIANFLDPRWKLLALELSEEDRDTIKNDVLEMMKEIFQAKHPVLQHPIDTSNDNSLEVTPMSPTTAAIQAAMDAEEARLGATN